MRIAVVSPFLDRRHGTERCIVEQIERFLQDGCVVHVYSQSIRDMEVVRPSGRTEVSGKAIWHRIPSLPGPHLVNFFWWYAANQALRWFQRTFQSLHFDVVFSPGINCADVDAIVVHIVFHEFVRLVGDELKLRDAPLRTWPVLIHRRLYYRLIMALENRIYRRQRVALAAVSGLTARELAEHFGRTDVTVILNAVDLARFNAPERLRRRPASRKQLQISEDKLVLLLVGNDWKKKGLPTLLGAVAANPGLPFYVLVVGRDNREPFLAQIQESRLEERVCFAEASADVMQFCAAADVYVGPSLHDSFALPPLEAMACGLPVITTATNGGAQIITEGVDGFVLSNAKDVAALAQLLRRLYEEPETRLTVGENAARTVQSLTWQRNARETLEFLTKAFGQKDGR
jgi:glycosyltransferase involved in cell wall biosynthesis